MDSIAVVFGKFLLLPVVFFRISPEGILQYVPLLDVLSWVGITALAIGITLGVRSRQRALLWFLLPVLLSQVLVAAAWLTFQMRSQAPGPTSQIIHGPFVNGAFLVVQVATAAYLVYRLKGARLPAAVLSGFSLSYGIFAAILAIMATAEAWP